MAITKIEWADYTFNPWIGCTKVKQADGKLHPACVNCYAERDFDLRKGLVKWGKGHPRHRTGETNWKKPLQWNNKVKETGLRTVFCASLADIFDSEVEQSWRDDLWKLVEATPNLTWLILTKRPMNVMLMIPPSWKENPPKNIMLGTSVSDQATADEFISQLISLGHLFRLFVSAEPLLDHISMKKWVFPQSVIDGYDEVMKNFKAPPDFQKVTRQAAPHLARPIRISWLIVGGESGGNARPMHPDWVRSLRDECIVAQVPFHFKQWGEWLPASDSLLEAYPSFRKYEGEIYDGQTLIRIGKKKAGRSIDGRQWNQFPEVIA